MKRPFTGMGQGIAWELRQALARAEKAEARLKQLEDGGMVTDTMEELLAVIEKAGWRMTSLSHIRKPDAYTCILERSKPAHDGYSVWATSDIVPTPREALASAWAKAQIKLSDLNKVKTPDVRPQIEAVEKSPAFGKLLGALSRWADAYDPQEDF